MLTFDDDKTAPLLAALGLPDGTEDVDLVLQTAQDLADQVGGMDAAKPSAVAAAAKRVGLEVVDGASLEVLRRDAAEGRTIKAAAERAKVEASVDDAIRKGKITPARRKHWLSLLSADPGMAEVLASVPDETAAPITEMGHSAADESDLAAVAEWFR